MLKVEQYVDAQTLRKWVNSWDESLYINYFNEKIEDRMKRMKVRSSMEENIVKIKTLCSSMETLEFTEFMGLMNRIVFNCYFKQGDSALQLANFYEEILVPADQTTRNRMFGYKDGRQEIGDLMMEYQGEAIGHLGEQSDMFRLIFDVCFAAEDTMFDGNTDLMEDTPPFLLAAQEEGLLTLKVWKHNALNLSMDRFVDLFLYHCSTHLGLNFKRASFEAPPDVGLDDALQETIDFQPFEAEQLPLMYFNSAAHNLPPQMVFMSYFHVLSHFFERAGNQMMYAQMQSIFHEEDLQSHTQLQKMSETLRSLNQNLDESDLLSLILEGIFTHEALTEFMQWLDDDAHRKRWFTHFNEKHRDLAIIRVTSKTDLIRSLVQRIQGIKASLCGEENENTLAAPLSTRLLQEELPLLKYLAAAALEVWSKPKGQ